MDGSAKIEDRTAVEPKVHLQMTLAQAEAFSRAADLFTRLGLGQFEELGRLADTGEFKTYEGEPATAKQARSFREFAMGLKSIMGHHDRGSFGLGSAHVSLDAHRVYELMKVVDRALAFHRNPSPKAARSDVRYDGLILRYTNDTAPHAEVVSSRVVRTGDEPGF
jgi:hypothetical protein